ncbi:hypothetical protein CU097_002965, partial [Rhizopus azygosporus]
MLVSIEEEIRLWSLEQVSQGVCIMELIETATIAELDYLHQHKSYLNNHFAYGQQLVD